MALNTDRLKERLRETFGRDSQETVAGKLNMTQGTISKLLSGAQQPTIDTLYNIANVYSVSVDWLLGISERKNINKSHEVLSYSDAVDSIQKLKLVGAEVVAEKSGTPLTISVPDPLLRMLVRKSLAIHATDKDLYQSWKNGKLSLFDDKFMLWKSAWRDENVAFLASEAVTEANWVEVYEEAKRYEEEMEEMLYDPGPFGK